MKETVLQRISHWFQGYKNNVLAQRLSTVLAIDVLVKLSGVVLLPIYLYLMTQEEFGLYGYLLSTILTFAVVLNFGLYIPLSKFYHDFVGPQEKGRLLFTIGALLFGLLTAAIFPIYFFRLDYALVKILFKNDINYSNYRIPVLLAVVTTVLNFTLVNFFFASEKISQVKRYNICRVIAINVITLAALYYFRNADTVEVRLASTYIVEFLLFAAFSYYVIREVRPAFNKKIIFRSLKLALPIMGSAIFGIINNFSDKFFLEKYGSFTDLSYYYLAVSCASLIPLIFTSFQNAWLPLFLKEKNLRVNVVKTNKFVLRLFLLFLGLSIGIIIFLKILIATNIIAPKYTKTLYILPIVLLAQTFSQLVHLYSNYLIYFGKTYIASIASASVCLLTILLSTLIIPIYNVYGAAAVTLASGITYLAVYYLIVKYHVRKRLRHTR